MAVIGSGYFHEADTVPGTAYVFVRSGTCWSEQARLIASDGAAGDWFGTFLSTSISGNTGLVGALREDTMGTDAGAAYVYEGLGVLPVEISCPPDIPDLECGASTDPADTGWATATPADPAPTITYEDSEEEGDCPGSRVIRRTWTATDPQDANNVASCVQTINVVDTTPPMIQAVMATPDTLWPPNRDMVPVTVSVAATDACDASPTCRVVSVTCNENAADDVVLTGNLGMDLRAERDGTGDGRVYTIHVTCTDASGNAAAGTVRVTVPHDQGKKK